MSGLPLSIQMAGYGCLLGLFRLMRMIEELSTIALTADLPLHSLHPRHLDLDAAQRHDILGDAE